MTGSTIVGPMVINPRDLASDPIAAISEEHRVDNVEGFWSLGQAGLWGQAFDFSDGTATSVPAAGNRGGVGPTATLGQEVIPVLIVRWLLSQSLAAPEQTGQVAAAALPWLIVVGVTMGLMILIQGPRRALSQLLDLPGHLALLARSLKRLTGSFRLLITLAVTVILGWIGDQSLAFVFDRNLAEGELVSLLRSRGVTEIAMDRGAHALLTPLRDPMCLSGYLLLMAVAIVVMLNSVGERWDERFGAVRSTGSEASIGTLILALLMVLLTFYRFALLFTWSRELPIGSTTTGLMTQGVAVPLLMLVSDASLLAWVLTELRQARMDRSAEAAPMDFRAITASVPACLICCALAMPSRYLAALGVSTQMAGFDLSGVLGADPLVGLLQRIRQIQVLAWPMGLLVAALVWGRGTLRGLVGGLVSLLPREGMRLVVVLVATSLGSAGIVALSTWTMLNVGGPRWAMAAAESYGHYGTMILSLIALAGMVDRATAQMVDRTPSTRRADKMLALNWDEAYGSPLDLPPLIGSPPAIPSSPTADRDPGG